MNLAEIVAGHIDEILYDIETGCGLNNVQWDIDTIETPHTEIHVTLEDLGTGGNFKVVITDEDFFYAAVKTGCDLGTPERGISLFIVTYLLNTLAQCSFDSLNSMAVDEAFSRFFQQEKREE